jgi:hypothetical protein
MHKMVDKAFPYTFLISIVAFHDYELIITLPNTLGDQLNMKVTTIL